MNNGELKIDNESLTVGEASARYRSSAVNSPSVPPGYKQTEVGVIPEDWNLVKLRQIVEGNRLPSGIYKDKKLYGRGAKIIKLGDVFNFDYFLPDLAQRVELSNDEITNYRVKLGDIFIALASVKLEGVGKVMLVTALDEDTTYDHNVALIRLIQGVDQKYIFYLFKSEMVRKLVTSRATQVGTTFLKTSTILEFPIALPSEQAEQRAIAAVLSDVDALLAKLDQLIAKKLDLKQAAMQQLLTGQTRLPGFSEEWQMKRLGDLGRFLKGSGVKKDETRSGDLPCIRYGEIYTHHNDYIKAYYSWISPEVAATGTLLKPGDVLFAGSGETKEEIGKCVAFIDDIEAYAGGDIVIFRSDRASPMFLGYYFNTAPVKSQKASRGQGDAVVHISATALSNIEVKIPGVDEQTTIATILSDMDAEIAALEARRDKTKDLKQGMMQELLTGRIRLL